MSVIEAFVKVVLHLKVVIRTKIERAPDWGVFYTENRYIGIVF